MKNQDFNLLNRIIIGPGYPLRGGISESNQALHNYFQENGAKSTIVSYSLQYPSFLFPGKKQTIDTTVNQHDVNRTISLINTLNPGSWISTVRWILKQKPDYVIIRYWHPYFAFCLSCIARILRLKSIFVIAWVDNAYPHEPMLFQKHLAGFFFKSCNAFLVMSHAVRNQLVQYGNVSDKKIQISPHPIYNIFGDSIDKKIAQKNIGISDMSICNNEKYILFFGLIRAYKGLDLLLEAMALESIQNMNIKLIIAGEFYDPKEKYMKKIHKLNLVNRVVLHDYYIQNKNVKNYFCASDIVVQPYLSATQSGVSMVAINFNKPMILTNVGGLSEYVTHDVDGYLVEPNPESIAVALQDYYKNDREEPFSNMLKKKKSSYSWLELADKFDSLYKDLSDV